VNRTVICVISYLRGGLSFACNPHFPSYTAEIPGYGDRCAVTMCERLDIKSTKDKDKLKQAKDEVYLKGFYEGVMLVGECAGMKVRCASHCAYSLRRGGTRKKSASRSLKLQWYF
jgi:hypothetical protein